MVPKLCRATLPLARPQPVLKLKGELNCVVPHYTSLVVISIIGSRNVVVLFVLVWPCSCPRLTHCG